VLPYLPSLTSLSRFLKPRLVSVYVPGGVVQRQEFAPLLGRIQNVPLKREGFLIPNQIGTYLCGSKNGREICYRILDCTEMGVNVLKVTMETRSIRPRTYESKLTAKIYVSPTTTNGFEMCGVLNANHGLWGIWRLLEAKW